LNEATAHSAAVRKRGALIIAIGVAFVVGGAALFYWLISSRSADFAKSAAAPFFIGFVMILEGAVELFSGKRWGEHASWARMLFIVLGTPAAVAAVIGALVLISDLLTGTPVANRTP